MLSTPLAPSPSISRLFASNRALGRTQLAAGALLATAIAARLIAVVYTTMTVAGLATLLGISMLALALALSCDDTVSPIDRLANQMCRRAGLVQTVVGLVTLALAIR